MKGTRPRQEPSLDSGPLLVDDDDRPFVRPRSRPICAYLSALALLIVIIAAIYGLLVLNGLLGDKAALPFEAPLANQHPPGSIPVPPNGPPPTIASTAAASAPIIDAARLNTANAAKAPKSTFPTNAASGATAAVNTSATPARWSNNASARPGTASIRWVEHSAAQTKPPSCQRQASLQASAGPG